MFVSRRNFCELLLGVLSSLVHRIKGADRVTHYELDRFCVAGFQYHEGPRWLSRISHGDAVILRAEPENPHDAGAIRLEWKGRHLGYVPRTRNGLLVRLLSQGAPVQGRITAVAPSAEPWQAVEVAIIL